MASDLPVPPEPLEPPVRPGRRLLHDTLETFGTKALVLGLSLIAAAVTARWLGPDGKGKLTLALLVPNLLAMVLGGGLGAANVYFLGSGRLPLARLARSSLGYGLVASVAGLGLAALLEATGLLARWLPGVPGSLLLVALTALPLAILSASFAGLLLGLRRIDLVNRIQLAQTVGSTVLVLGLVLGLGGGVVAAILAFVAAAAGALLAHVLLVSRQAGTLRPAIDPATLRPTLRYGWRAQAGSMLQFFNYRLDVFVVNFLVGVEQVGIYGVAVSLAELLWQLPDAVGFALFPRAAAGGADDVHQVTRRALRATLVLTSLGAAGLAAVGAPLVRGVFGPEFAGAYVPMLLLLPGVVLLGGGKVLTSAIAGRGHPGLNSLNAGAALVVTLVGNVVLVPRHGIAGAAAASSLAYAVNFALALAFYARLRRRG